MIGDLPCQYFLFSFFLTQNIYPLLCCLHVNTCGLFLGHVEENLAVLKRTDEARARNISGIQG